jgi:hypothetical protein
MLIGNFLIGPTAQKIEIGNVIMPFTINLLTFSGVCFQFLLQATL